MVELALGKREFISFGKESTYGTSATRTYRFGRNAEVVPSLENDWQEVSGSGTDTETLTYDIGNKIVRFTLRYVPQDWKFLTFVFGTTTNTNKTGYYEHTFSTKSDWTIPSFTLERAIQKSTDFTTIYSGCQVNSFTLSWRVQTGTGGRGNYVQAEADILAQDIDDSTSTTNLSAPTTAGFMARNVILTIDGDTKARCISGSVTINNNLHDGRYAYYSSSTRLKSESFMQRRTFTGEFVLHYTDKTEFDLWNSGSAVSGTCSLVFQRGTHDKLTLTFTNLRIISPNDPTNLDGYNLLTIRWIADDISAVAEDSLNDYPT